MHDYSFIQWLLIFYIYAFAGWIFECCVVSIQQKHPVNRGFLRGPMLPIYGFGAIIMIYTALPLNGNPIKVYFAGLVVATIFEYVVGVLMEAIFHVKYWDYSEHRFQFQGRICLQSSLAWGVLSVLLIFVFQPPINSLLEQFTTIPLLFTVIILSVYFVTDVVASVKTAFDLSKSLAELDKMRIEVRRMRKVLADQAEQKRDELSTFVHQGRSQLSDSAEQGIEQLKKAIALAEQKIDKTVEQMHFLRKSMIKGNPTLKSTKFDETLQYLRKRLRK